MTLVQMEASLLSANDLALCCLFYAIRDELLERGYEATLDVNFCADKEDE